MPIALKPENIAQLVFFIRGEKVMLDADLARLYGVTTGNLNKAVRRNQVLDSPEISCSNSPTKSRKI